MEPEYGYETDYTGNQFFIRWNENMTRIKVDPTNLLQYHSKGMTDEQLAEKFKCRYLP